MSFGLDRASRGIFTKKLSFDIHWDDVAGTKTNPRIDVQDFGLGGLLFQVMLRPHTDPIRAHAIWLELTEASRRILASDFHIKVNYAYGWVRQDGTEGGTKIQTEEAVAPNNCSLIHFNQIKHFDIDLEMKFEDVFPHRLKFVDAEVAKKDSSDCKILLVDDENKPIFVRKHILAYRSPFFETLFFGDFVEKNQSVVKLGDIFEEEFLEYLFAIYSPSRPLAFKRLNTLLTLADRFHNTLLMDEIETFMLQKVDKTPDEKRQALILADTYRMPVLFRETLEKMDGAELKGLDPDKCCEFTKENSKLLYKRSFDLH